MKKIVEATWSAAVFDGANLAIVMPMGDLWMIEPGHSVALIERFQGMTATQVSKMSSRCLKMQEEARPAKDVSKPDYKTVGRTGLIRLEGVMTKRPHSMMDDIGGTSTVVTRAALRHAVMQNDSLDRVWLNIDSPGGDQAGAFDLAEDVARLKQVKPIYGFADGDMMSAAFLVGSQCTGLYGTRSMHGGSLGAYTKLTDNTGADRRAGRKVFIIKAGDKKAIGAGGPVTPEQLAVMQERIDAIQSLFVQMVAEGRGLNLEQMTQIADASVHIGAANVGVGIVDGIMNADDFYEMIEGGTTPRRGTIIAMGRDNTTNKRQVAAWMGQNDDEDDEPTFVQPQLKPRHYQLLANLERNGIKTSEQLDQMLQMAGTGQQALISMRARVTALSVVALGAETASTVEDSIKIADLPKLQKMSADFTAIGMRQGLLTADGMPGIRRSAPAPIVQYGPPQGYGPAAQAQTQPYGQQQYQQQQAAAQPQPQLQFAAALEDDPRALLAQQGLAPQSVDKVDAAKQVLLNTPALAADYSF